MTVPINLPKPKAPRYLLQYAGFSIKPELIITPSLCFLSSMTVELVNLYVEQLQNGRMAVLPLVYFNGDTFAPREGFIVLLALKQLSKGKPIPCSILIYGDAQEHAAHLKKLEAMSGVEEYSPGHDFFFSNDYAGAVVADAEGDSGMAYFSYSTSNS